MTELFGGRKTKKELANLKEEHHDLEEKFDNLQGEHERLQHEAGEETNMRISYIEEEIENMNVRVEKLASDSYEIRNEVRDIHESVLGMQTSLSEIVKLYKAILSQYGFGNMKANPPKATERRTKPGEDPGDAIVRALEEEQGRAKSGTSSRTASSKTATKARPSGMTASPPQSPPRLAPSSSNALNELHRLKETQKERGTENGESLADKLESRSGRGDKVDRVARRDLDRPGTTEMEREGEFTRSLPKKEIRPKAEVRDNGAEKGDGWEAMHPPSGPEGRERRPKPKLEDLLSPE